MIDRIRAYPMIVLLIPLVTILLLCEKKLYFNTNFNQLDKICNYTFVITSEPRPTDKCERYEAQVLNKKVLLYVFRDSTVVMPLIGDTVIAQTKIILPDSIGTFDYSTYLRRQGFIGTSFIYPSNAVIKPNTIPLKPSLRTRLYRRLEASGLNGDELATVGAMTLGYKEDIDKNIKHHFQNSGAAHVLAVSGLHTGIIYAILIWLLTLGGRIKPMYENKSGRCAVSLIIIAVMWFYAWLTGMTPSVVRAVIMVTFFEVGRMFYRQSISVNSIAAAAFIILIIRPLDLWSISFQLSFTATLSIVLLYQSIENQIYKFIDKSKGIITHIALYFIGIIIVSIAAQIGTLPVTMYTFGRFNTYFLITNILILPLATLLVPCGLISIVLGGSWIGIIIGKITWILAWLMNNITQYIDSWKYSTIDCSVNIWMVVIYYCMLCLLLVCIYHRPIHNR